MAKLPQDNIILPETLPAASLGSGTGFVNKWNHWLPEDKRIGARPMSRCTGALREWTRTAGFEIEGFQERAATYIATTVHSSVVLASLDPTSCAQPLSSR
jgi:hypothetical protein